MLYLKNICSLLKYKGSVKLQNPFFKFKVAQLLSPVKSKINTFFFQERTTRASHNLNKTKPNSSSINKLMSNIWILPRSSGLPQEAWVTSLTPPSAAHTTFFRPAQASSSPLRLPFLVVIPWHCQLQSAGVFHCS